jgi:hypothetical protein
MADIVTVKQQAWSALLQEDSIQGICDGGFSRSTQAGEPNDTTNLA